MNNSSQNIPLVSVFMLTYNHDKYITQALDSILMQKVNFNYEIVVGEDCSTDKTREILIKYSNNNPDRFKLILHEKNIGASNNQFITLSECRGRYIALLEGDDYWTDNFKLQKQVEFLENNPDYSICYHPIEYIYEEKEPKRIFDNSNNESETTYTQDLIKNDYIPACSCVMRTDNLKKIPPWFKIVIPGDYPLLLLASFGKKIFRLNEKMAAYRVHSNSNWSSKKYTYLLTNTLNMFRHLEKDTPEKYLQNIWDKMYDIKIDLYKSYLVENSIISALKMIPQIYFSRNHQTMKIYFATTKIIIVSFIRRFIKKRKK